jgi:hypothetical protein
MRKLAAATISAILLWSVATSANAQSFKNCTEVRKMYPMGVAKSKASAKKQKNYPVNNPFVSASVYASLVKLDRDKDGTACEK